MIATLAVVSTTPYQRWHQHFLDSRDTPDRLPWDDAAPLSGEERRVVASSIRQFQLGEWARGRGFLRRAAKHPVLSEDSWAIPALQLFIAEEQRHSAMLGQFLDREGIPRLTHDWADLVFRRLRKLAGLEMCAMVLVTAEVLAVPFYQALRDATHSRLLRAICARILRDEVAHLQYQGLTLGLIRRDLSERARRMRSYGHAVLFHATALLLWCQHRQVFLAAGCKFGRFWADARRWFAYLQHRIELTVRDHGQADVFGDLRLD